MKIIVSCEVEKLLLERFIEEIDMSEDFEDIHNQYDDKDTDLMDKLFIKNGLTNADIEVGITEPMYTNHLNLMLVCPNCGSPTEGIGDEDEDELDYEKFHELNNKYNDNKDWQCSGCDTKDNES